MPSRTCSHCGNNGHNLRTCSESGGGGGNGIMLFGVRVMEEGSFRKSVSMGNLSQYQQSHDPTAEAAYASDDAVHASVRNRERRRGVPWTEEEHRLFLLGLQKVGKGDWRGISRSFVKTRTPTQVASHAQKYFLRRSNHNRRRRRSSLFDITTEMCMSSSIEEDKKVSSTALPFGIQSSVESLTLKQSDISVPVLPSDLSLNHQVCTVDILPPPALSLMLRTPLLSDQTTVATVRPPSSAFPVPMSGGNFGGSGENIISVA